METMTGTRSIVRSTVAAGIAAVSLVLAACASAPPPAGPSIAQRIESAKTRSDHEWLGDYYDRQAAQARASAEQHRKMGDSYSVWGDRRQGSGMSSHCRILVEQYERAAAEYAAMAKLHHQLAGQATQ